MLSTTLIVARTAIGKKAAAAAFLFVLASYQASATVSGDVPFARYDSILARAPFGPLPEVPGTNDLTSAVEPAVIEEPYIIPPGLDKIKVTLLSRFRGVPAAGFTDGSSNIPYYLVEGQEGPGCDDFKLIKVDFAANTIRLRRGGYEADLPMWINPATTNQADVATFGMAPGTAPGGGKTLSATPLSSRLPPPAMSAQELQRREEMRKLREEARKKREETRKAQAEELAKLTPEERERRLHDLNVELIINDGGPPLPLELDERDKKKLSEAGFEVPGYNAKSPNGK